MDDEVTGDQIQAYLTGKLSMLKYADHYAREADEVARQEARIRGQAEWDALDADSKEYLLHFLKNSLSI